MVQARVDAELVRGEAEERFESTNEVEWRDADLPGDVLDGWGCFVVFAQEFAGAAETGEEIVSEQHNLV